VIVFLLADLLVVGTFLDGGGCLASVIAVAGLCVRDSRSTVGRVVIFTFYTTLDHKSLRVREFNVDLVLGQAGQLAVEMISVLGFTDIKSGGKAANGGVVLARSVDIIVVQEAEERREVIDTREESHC